MRALLLFARSPEAEVRAKRLNPAAKQIFEGISRSWREIAIVCEAKFIVADRQRGQTFGERLANSVEDAFAAGVTALIVVGIDTPALASSQVRRIFDELESGQVVSALGPATDGGIYLIGLTRAERPLLESITLRQCNLMQVCRAYFRGMISVLPLESDLDSAADVKRIATEALWLPYRRLLEQLASPARWMTLLSPPPTAMVQPSEAPRAPPHC